MKKLTILAFALMFVFSAMAQVKMLSSKQLMSRGLYPNYPMRGIQFVGNTNKVAYVKNDTLFVEGKCFLTLDKLNEAVVAKGEHELHYLGGLKMESDKQILLSVNGKMMRYDVAKKTLTLVCDGSQNVAPGANRYAYNDDNALVIMDNGREIRCGSKDEQGVVYGQSVHRNEFGIDGGIFWSPKGNKMAYYRMDESMVADYPLVRTSNKGIAESDPFKYPMAGEKSHEVTIEIIDLNTSSIIGLATRKNTSVHECEMYLTNVCWSPDEQFIYVAKVNREQNHMWFERYNAETGKLDKVLFEEQNDRYVEPCDPMMFLPNDPTKFIWFSMRDGYKHLYLYNIDGSLVKQLTFGEYEVEGIIGFDTKCENLFVYANKDNLAGKGAYRVNMKTLQMTRLTPIEGTHTVQISADGKSIVDIYSSVNVPAKAQILDAKGNVKKVLFESENPLAEYAMPTYKLGTIKAADGQTDLFYRLITPPNMDPTKKYPTLVYVYGGPHSQLVTDSWLAGANLYFTFLAQQGYVVFTLDNRGTDNRGFEFESCTHRQLGTIEMADQMEGVKFLQSLPYVDQSRMGVEGWSFGGFMTITMKLAHPEIFKVGCAGGPVINWKWYEIMYGERYMDTPQENPEGYANNCLLDKAKDLEGRLLVIHGAEDNTVVWQHSIEFNQACIKAGKLVDYYFYPHHQHNVLGGDRVHLFEKMFDYYETFLK